MAWLKYGGTRRRKGEPTENTNLNLNRARQSSTLLVTSTSSYWFSDSTATASVASLRSSERRGFEVSIRNLKHRVHISVDRDHGFQRIVNADSRWT